MYKKRNSPPPIAEEAAVKHNASQAEDISPSSILGVSKNISLDNPISYMQVAEEGLTKNNFNRLKKFTGLDTETLADILSVTSRTLQRKKLNDRFKQGISEKMLEIADLYVLGIKIFGEKVKFQAWLNSHILALGNNKPVDYIYSSYGRSYIKQLLGRIDYGVYS